MVYNDVDKQHDIMTKKIAIIGGKKTAQLLAKEALSTTPWNKGKRKPVTDDYGNEWCNCIDPKLTSNAGGRGQAYCLKCGTPWYH